MEIKSAQEIVLAANAAGIVTQEEFLAFAVKIGIEATDYDEDGAMLFLGADEPVVRRDEGAGWVVTHL